MSRRDTDFTLAVIIAHLFLYTSCAVELSAQKNNFYNDHFFGTNQTHSISSSTNVDTSSLISTGFQLRKNYYPDLKLDVFSAGLHLMKLVHSHLCCFSHLVMILLTLAHYYAKIYTKYRYTYSSCTTYSLYTVVYRIWLHWSRPELYSPRWCILAGYPSLRCRGRPVPWRRW